MKFCLVCLAALSSAAILISGCVHPTNEPESVREPASFHRRQPNQPVQPIDAIAVRKVFTQNLNVFLYGHRDESPATTKPQTPFPKLYGDEDPTVINSCIQATCGPAGQNWNAESVLYRPGTNLTPAKLWNQSFKPKLLALMDREKKADIWVANRMDQLVQSGVQIQPGQPLQALFAFMLIDKAVSGHMTEVLQLNPETHEITVNVPARDRFIETLPAALRVATIIFINKLVAPSSVSLQTQGDPFENSLSKRLKLKYPGRNLKEAQQIDATDTLERVSRIQFRMGSMLAKGLIDDYALAVFRKAKLGIDLSKIESKAYTDTFSMIQFMGSIYDDDQAYTALMAIPVDLNQVLKDARATSFSSAMVNEATSRSIDDRLSQLESVCLSKMQFAFDLNTSPLRLRQAAEMAEAVKLAAKKVLTVDPLTENNNGVLDAVSKIEFALPDPNTQLAKNLKAAVLNAAASVSRTEILMAAPGPDTDQLLLQLLALSSANGQKPGANNFDGASTVKKACDDLPIATVSDYTLTSLGKIAISWYTAAYPAVGVSIFAHEVGHVVSHAIRDQQIKGGIAAKFTNVLSCVANRNPFVMEPVNLSKQNNTNWSEEDWADHFSSMVMNYMMETKNKWASPVNKGCALVENDSKTYLEKTLQPGAGDPHSSGILRLLFIGTDRGSLPAVCSPLLSYATANHRELVCR